jgi:X-X-X-Leu-X-X-Gly heptad repeat protein
VQATIGLWISYVGMTLVMIAGATWPAPEWRGIALGILIVVAGIVVKQRAGAPPIELSEGAAVSARVARSGNLLEGVKEMVSGVTQLAAGAQELALQAIKERVEDLNYLGPDRIAEAQEALAARIGFTGYAEVMAPLATAERLLNRAWSAATDGHRPECVRALSEAVAYAKEAEQVAERVLKGV